MHQRPLLLAVGAMGDAEVLSTQVEAVSAEGVLAAAKGASEHSSTSSYSSDSSSSSESEANAADGDDHLPPLVADFEPTPDWHTPEDTSSRLDVYMVTLAALVTQQQLQQQSEGEVAGQPPLRDVSGMSREEVRDAVLHAVSNPVWCQTRGGRPRKNKVRVMKLVVFREQHRNGKFHFHVALKLSCRAQFAGFKASLLKNHRLASHWSTTHTQFWSMVRYGYFTTDKKPVVDVPGCLPWSHDGSSLDLYKESQEPWNASAHQARREKREREAYAVATPGAKKKAKTDEKPFSKMDFFALVEKEDLKTPAAVMAFAKKQGSASLRAFVVKSMKRLQELLGEAAEWIKAEETAAAERLSDWQLICSKAKRKCKCPDGLCQWWQAAEEFFLRNAETLDRRALAASLAQIIRFGPGKNSRVPLIEGCTNSAKTTVLSPIVAVFGFSKIVHRPGEKASMALANVYQGCRSPRVGCIALATVYR